MSGFGLFLLVGLITAFVVSVLQYRRARLSEEVRLFPWLAPTLRSVEPESHALYVKLRYGTLVVTSGIMILLLAITGDWRDVLSGWK